MTNHKISFAFFFNRINSTLRKVYQLIFSNLSVLGASNTRKSNDGGTIVEMVPLQSL